MGAEGARAGAGPLMSRTKSQGGWLWGPGKAGDGAGLLLNG